METKITQIKEGEFEYEGFSNLKMLLVMKYHHEKYNHGLGLCFIGKKIGFEKEFIKYAMSSLHGFNKNSFYNKWELPNTVKGFKDRLNWLNSETDKLLKIEI